MDKRPDDSLHGPPPSSSTPLVNVGALDQLQQLNGLSLSFGRKSLAGSMIGGVAETRAVRSRHGCAHEASTPGETY